jgi:hypothetical protein
MEVMQTTFYERKLNIWNLTCDDLVCDRNKSREVEVEDPNQMCGKLGSHNLNTVPTLLQCHYSHK